MPIVWSLFSVALGSLSITASIFLLKERHIGPWMMLAGSIFTLTGQIGSSVLQFLMFQSNDMGRIQWMMASGSFASFGALIFGIGLLLHALRQRGKADRIAELEAILRSHQG